MGRQAKAKAARRPEAIHLKRVLGGKTPAEVHRANTWAGHRCHSCGGPPAVQIASFMEAREFARRSPAAAAILASFRGGRLPVFKSRWGKLVKINEVFACDLCRKGAEIAAARASRESVYVFVDAGPKPWNRAFQVPDGVKRAFRTDPALMRAARERHNPAVEMAIAEAMARGELSLASVPAPDHAERTLVPAPPASDQPKKAAP